MHLGFILLSAAITLFASSNAVPTSEKTTLDSVHSAEAVQNMFLRTYKTANENDKDENSDGEERGSMNLVNRVNLQLILDETAALDKKYQAIKRQYTQTFKNIEEIGWTPASMSEKLGIANKLKTLDTSQLANDENYHLWVKFSEYWKNTHGDKTVSGA